MGVPALPLTDLYNAAGEYVRARGGVLHFRCPWKFLCPRHAGTGARASSWKRRAAPENLSIIWWSRFPLMPWIAFCPTRPESAPLREKISHFENSPITGIHLWFDRQISELDHAVLLDRTIQWMFHKSRLQPIRTQSGNGNSGGVISNWWSVRRSLSSTSRAARLWNWHWPKYESFSPARDRRIWLNPRS